jgi:membrane associated rhomboid family serine protease
MSTETSREADARGADRMSAPATAAPLSTPNGPGAAAILAAGIGALALGIFALVGEVSPAAKQAFTIWSPSGPLSGVTSGAVAAWLGAWAILSVLWRQRAVNLALVNLISFVFLAGALALTFPPFLDLLQGK